MMRNRIFTMAIVTLVTIAMTPAAHVAAQTVDQTVEIDAGRIEGAVSGEVLSFKGIPYAAPPVGNLRWRAPQPVKPWKGVRRTAELGNDCVQMPVPGDAAASGSKMGEDCLVLNVWRPSAVRSGEKLPVMVWIHGGGFLNGSAAGAFFDG
jgi:para-nitrobenzyl esterase